MELNLISCMYVHSEQSVFQCAWYTKTTGTINAVAPCFLTSVVVCMLLSIGQSRENEAQGRSAVPSSECYVFSLSDDQTLVLGIILQRICRKFEL